MANVALEHITKVFSPDVCAVRDVSMQIADGELVVLVGPSGCGKTTLLRIIAGLDRATSGIVRINGRDMSAVPPALRDVAMVFQRPALYPHLSVRRNLTFALELKRNLWMRAGAAFRRCSPGDSVISEAIITERVAEAASLLRLGEFLERRPGELSGGEQQRVALGRVLVRRAGVSLLDEPLSHLDFRLRTELRRELHLLQRTFHGTMLYVTHDPVEAMTLADRIAVMERGRLQQLGAPAEVYAQPASIGVASFFGWPPMNLIAGELLAEGRRRLFHSRDGNLILDWNQPSRAGSPNGVTLGIRAEDVKIALPANRIDGANSGPAVLMHVVLVESVGNTAWLRVERGGLQLAALTADGSITEGMDVDVTIEPIHCHCFDTATGLALVHPTRIG